MSKAVIVYALCELESSDVRYVGQTVDLHNRIWVHRSEAGKGSSLPVHRWIRKRDGSFRVAALAMTTRGAAADALEALCIERARALGHRLLNVTEGGVGFAGYVKTPEHVEKVAAFHRGRKKAPLSDETKARVSESQRLRMAAMSSEQRVAWRAKISASSAGKVNVGAVRTPEQRAKIAASLRARQAKVAA